MFERKEKTAPPTSTATATTTATAAALTQIGCLLVTF